MGWLHQNCARNTAVNGTVLKRKAEETVKTKMN